jgi:hypothetical protein
MDMRENIFNAMQKSKYKWRTANAIANELKLNINIVLEFLFKDPDIIVSRQTNKKGEQLFALKQRYYKEISTKTRILNAITHNFH